MLSTLSCVMRTRQSENTAQNLLKEPLHGRRTENLRRADNSFPSRHGIAGFFCSSTLALNGKICKEDKAFLSRGHCKLSP